MVHGCKIPYTRRDLYRSRFQHEARQKSDENEEKSKDLQLRDHICPVSNNLQMDNNCNREDGIATPQTVKFGSCKREEFEASIEPGLTSSGVDSVDYIRSTDTFSTCDIIIYLFSLCSYIADIGTDIWVAYMYFHQGHVIWFTLTLLFILIPAIVMTLFSLVWYIQDRKYSKTSSNALTGVSKVQWTSRTICLMLQVGLVIRYIECLVYGIRSKKDRHWFNMLAFEDTDSALLRLLECFLEATPQLALQLYIMMTLGLQNGWLMVIVQILSCLTSLSSVCWSLVSYHRALRYSLANKANITYGGMALQFSWRVFTVGPRVLTLAMFAVIYKYWTFVAIACHWIVMFLWILTQKTRFCDTRCKEFFFNVVMATVYIFCYLNLLEGHTRLRYVFFYTIMYLENMALMMAWYAVVSTSADWYVIPVLVGVFVGPLIGLLFMLVYYKCCHPNNLSPEFSHVKIKMCVPWSDLYLCQIPTQYLTHAVSHVQSEELQNLDGLKGTRV